MQTLWKYVVAKLEGIACTILIGFGKLFLLNGRGIVVEPIFYLTGLAGMTEDNSGIDGTTCHTVGIAGTEIEVMQAWRYVTEVQWHRCSNDDAGIACSRLEFPAVRLIVIHPVFQIVGTCRELHDVSGIDGTGTLAGRREAHVQLVEA